MILSYLLTRRGAAPRRRLLRSSRRSLSSLLSPSIYAKVTAACVDHAAVCGLLERGVNERGRPLDHKDYARLSKQTSAQHDLVQVRPTLLSLSLSLSLSLVSRLFLSLSLSLSLSLVSLSLSLSLSRLSLSLSLSLVSSLVSSLSLSLSYGRNKGDISRDWDERSAATC
jgi:hypothetical protein